MMVLLFLLLFLILLLKFCFIIFKNQFPSFFLALHVMKLLVLSLAAVKLCLKVLSVFFFLICLLQ